MNNEPYKYLLMIFLIIISANIYSVEVFDGSGDYKVDTIRNDKIGDMLLQSISLIGIPYKWGGNTPDSGLDCSGFIRYVYQRSLGIILPRTAADMAMLGKNITIEELRPGDLLFFDTLDKKRISHVGMYLGDNKFIQAPRAGKNIEITEFNNYYHRKFIVAKRIVQEDVNSAGISILSDIRSKRDVFTMKSNKSNTKHLKPKVKEAIKSRNVKHKRKKP